MRCDRGRGRTYDGNLFGFSLHKGVDLRGRNGRACIDFSDFPEIDWSSPSTFPMHFHDGDQATVVAAPCAMALEQGWRDFLAFVQRTMDA